MNETVNKAYQLAIEARKNSHSIYSKFAVGAALKVKDNEQIFTGCNVENSSFGATICAERTGLVKMVSEIGGNHALEFVVVVADTEDATPPCGLCLQQLSDFVDADTKVYLADLNSIKKEMKFTDAMPNIFVFKPEA